MDPESRELTKLRMQIVVSAVVLIVSLILILASGHYNSDCTKWAFGMVGLVVGYWLK